MSISHSNRRSTGLKLGLLSAAAALAFGGANVVQADAYSDAVLATDGLLAYYRMQETSGTTHAKNEVTGLTDGTTYHYGTQTTSRLTLDQTGPITGGTAVRVNYPNRGDHKETGDFGYLDVDTGATTWSNDYSVEMWFRPQLDFDEAPVQYVFTRTDAEPDGDATLGFGDAFGIRGTSTEETDDDGKLFLGSSGTHLDDEGNDIDPTPPAITSTNAVKQGNESKDFWYHAVMTRDGNTLTLYINELIVDKDTGEITHGFFESITDIITNDPIDGSSHAAFGARRGHKANLSFGGDIAEVAIYNGALSEEQVLAHFNTVIPEPGSLLLLGAGAAMMLYRRRTVS